jgi:hypothetical protein
MTRTTSMSSRAGGTRRARIRTAAVTAGAALFAGAALASSPAQAATTDVNARPSGSSLRAVAGDTAYRIQPVHSGKKMVRAVRTFGVTFEQRTIPSHINPLHSGELFYFHFVAQRGSYIVESVDGGCLDIQDGISKNNGMQLRFRVCDDTQSQDWFSNQTPDGSWTLVNRWSGKAATVPGTGENAVAQQFPYIGSSNQRFWMPAFHL